MEDNTNLRDELAINRTELAIHRTELAIQRTLLSYLRISIYFLVAYFTFSHFAENASPYYGYLFLIGSFGFLVTGIYNFTINYQQIKKEKRQLKRLIAK